MSSPPRPRRPSTIAGRRSGAGPTGRTRGAAWPGAVRGVRKAVHQASGRVLAERLEVADNFFSRGLGLMFRRRFEAGQGLWITSCNGIHMFFMSFPIDAVFLDRQRRVVKTYRGLPRWIGLVPLVWGADSVVELPAGTIDGLPLERGEQLLIESAG